jgi:hypothetical protein
MLPVMGYMSLNRSFEGSSVRDDSRDSETHYVANYVATMANDLAAMARRHGLDTLGYLLDMARLEAENQAGTGRSGRTSFTAS